MVCSVYYLVYIVVNINAPFAKWSITERDYFQILLLGILSKHGNPHFQIYRCCDRHFPGFDKYIFRQLQTCTALVLSADSTEASCFSNIIIFNNFLIFNFPFFNFEQITVISPQFRCCTQLSTKIAFKIPKII